jgi:hypothetical protein
MGITTREFGPYAKGSRLTTAEMDENFNYLNSKPYKVYTALLTQSGGDGPQTITSGTLTKGVTYHGLEPNPGDVWDFSNVGGPVYPDDFTFVATQTAEPIAWGNREMAYNTGAPVVTVLENTIGNIWFTYFETGKYGVTFSNPIVDFNKVTCNISNSIIGYSYGYVLNTDYPILLQNIELNNLQYTDSCLSNTPIEIRVYN